MSVKWILRERGMDSEIESQKNCHGVKNTLMYIEVLLFPCNDMTYLCLCLSHSATLCKIRVHECPFILFKFTLCVCLCVYVFFPVIKCADGQLFCLQPENSHFEAFSLSLSLARNLSLSPGFLYCVTYATDQRYHKNLCYYFWLLPNLVGLVTPIECMRRPHMILYIHNSNG